MNLSPAHRAALIFLAVAVAAVFAVRLTKLAAPQRKVNGHAFPPTRRAGFPPC